MHDLNPYNRVFGLTGVMGSGKSTVAELFRAGAEVAFDADDLSRYVINPTSPYYAQLRAKLTAAFTAVANADIFLAIGG
ncbi:MAG: dephospho-CoA kinase [Turneriella sp.]